MSQHNYFELYNLPIKFHPDMASVKSKFYELSKKYHPDFYANAPAEKQEEVLQKSTENNKAYKVLSNEKNLVKYLLELKNVLIEGEQYALSPGFLMEMMDINESLMDLEILDEADKLKSLKSEIVGISNDLNGSLEKLTLLYDCEARDNEQLLLEIKDIYYRQKYVWRIQERLKE